jgi:hypothetical protein
MKPGIGRHNGAGMHTGWRLRGVVEQLGDTRESDVGRLDQQACNRAMQCLVGVQDHSARPGSCQLAQVSGICKKGDITGFGLGKRGYAGEDPVCFTGESQTKTIRQFSQ